MKELSLVDSGTFGFMVADIARMSRALLEKRIETAGLGVTPGEARALLHIAAREGERQTQLAERMGIEPMTACGYIDRLEKRGLVTRTVDPSDRRAKQVSVTQAAGPLVDAIVAATAAMREDILAGLDADEREIMIAALGKVHTRLTGLLAPAAAEAAE